MNATAWLRRLQGLTFRLALAYSVWFVLSFATMLGLAYWASVHIPLSRVEASVRNEALDLARLYRDGSGRAALVEALEVRMRQPARRQAYHVLRDERGRVLAANVPLQVSDVMSGAWIRFEFDSYEAGFEREHEALLYKLHFADGARLLVGRDTDDLDEREDLIVQALGWSSGMALLLGLLGGLLISGAVGRRIDSIARTAEGVMAGDLAGRVAVRGTGDDFDHLATTLNAMLDRIEDLVQSLGRVSDSVAHELRTPLARLTADLEELRAAPDARTREQLATQAIASAARLQSTFDALLRIARVETGRHELDMDPVDLSALLRDAAELYVPVVADRGMTLLLQVPDGLALRGDRDLLFQAFANLLDNAVKYGRPQGSITLGAARGADTLSCWVADDGPGLAAEERGRLTERFYRAPEHRNAEGLGLGLTFVAAVARRHDAQLRIEDQRPGLRVSLEFRCTPPT